MINRLSFLTFIVIIFSLILSQNSQAYIEIENNINIKIENSIYENQYILERESQLWVIIITVGEITRDANNIDDLTDILTINGFSNDNIFKLIEENATKSNILNLPFEWLQTKNIDENDIILFYFSMHGDRIQDINPIDESDNYDEYLVPYDYENGSNYILDEELNNKFEFLELNNLILIFETCYSGGMIDGDNDIKNSGSIVLTSCDNYESSWPIFFGNKWLFPHYLFKGLTGEADLNNDLIITVEESFLYAEKPTIIRSTILAMIYSFIPFIPHDFYAQNPQIYDAWPSIENNTSELSLIYLMD